MTLTIGEVIKALQTAKKDLNVYFDFARCVPTYINSWRGIYAEPAIGWAPTGYSGDDKTKTPNVAEFLSCMYNALRLSYHGWKGGEYSYDINSPLHVDNPGDCTNTDLARIEITEYEVILHTTKYE